MDQSVSSVEEKLNCSDLDAGEIHFVDISEHLSDLVAVLQNGSCRLCQVVQ